jgi:hypothetical protein
MKRERSWNLYSPCSLNHEESFWQWLPSIYFWP